MAGFRYLWLIETKSGRWKFKITRGKKGPMPGLDGFITLFGIKYGVNPQRFRDWTFKLGKFQKKRFYRVQVWKENDPEPLNFFHITMPEPRFTSEMISTAAKAKKIREVIPSEGLDLIKVVLVLESMALIGVMIWLISQVKFQ